MRLFRGLLVAAVLLIPGMGVSQPVDKPTEKDGKQKVLSDREKADDAQQALAEMRDALTNVNNLIDQARKDKDTLRLNCVNEKKTQISGLVKVAELSFEDLKNYLKQRESEGLDHEFEKVGIAKRRVTKLGGEAQECIGQLAFVDTDKVIVDVGYPADYPKVDPTSPELLPQLVFRPPAASPTR